MKITKKWFDDWHLETKWVGKYRRLILRLPHAKTRQKTFNYYEEDMHGRFEDFESILSSCFDQIQQDHGGYIGGLRHTTYSKLQDKNISKGGTLTLEKMNRIYQRAEKYERSK